MMAATYGDPSATATPGLVESLKHAAVSMGNRYSELSRQGRRTRMEQAEMLVLNAVRIAVSWTSTQRIERGIYLNSRLMVIRNSVERLNHRTRITEAGLRANLGLLRHIPAWPSYVQLPNEHDLVQYYGLEAIKGVFVPRETPFVAFEHSTMRTLPFENTVQGRLLNLAY
ncbi:MAG: hypothetical protein EBY11_02485, partial [Proteobacteria bacterium]|nr:hypothetical protein [Pseudomonadota bacterium]